MDPPDSITSSLADDTPVKDRKRRRLKNLRLKIRRKKRQLQDELNVIHAPLHSELSPMVIRAKYEEPPLYQANLEEAKRIMYLSHLVAKFSELGWQFCLILFLTALTSYKSLTLVATYGLFTGIVVCLSGSSAGAMIDNKERDRLDIAQFFIWVQNSSVVTATSCCFFLLRSVHVTTIEGDQYTKISSSLIPDLAPPATIKTWLLIIAVHIFGALGKLTDESMTIALERDWIVVMSKVARGDHEHDNNSTISSDSERNVQLSQSYDSVISSLSVGEASLGSHTEMNTKILHDLKEKTWLSQTNTAMKQIDLICRIAAPAAAGIFFAFFDDYRGGGEIISKSHWDNLSYGAMVIGVLNLISLFLENLFIEHIYELVPSLSERNETIPRVACPSHVELQEDDEDRTEKMSVMRSNGKFRLSTIQSGIIKTPSMNAPRDQQSKGRESSSDNRCKPFSIPKGLGVYCKQSIAFGGFALSLLYLNVLCFGALMTAYLVFRGLSYETIGVLRGLSAIIGLTGTIAYQISIRRSTLSFTGSWSIIFQFSCLTFCYASLFVMNDKFSIALLLIGVIASRIGLYVFDLTITQMMQQMIPEDVRGLVGGVQKSLNSLFELSTYALGLFYPKPEDFHVLVATGFMSVALAMCIYLGGIHRNKAEVENS